MIFEKINFLLIAFLIFFLLFEKRFGLNLDFGKGIFLGLVLRRNILRADGSEIPKMG